MRKFNTKIAAALLLLSVGLLLASCSSDPSTSGSTTEAAEAAAPTPLTFGGSVEVEGLRISTMPEGIIEDTDFLIDGEFIARWDEVEVLLENVSGAPLEYSVGAFALQDEAGVMYYGGGGLESGQIGMGTLQPGAKIRGTLGFSMEQDAKPTTLIYWSASGEEIRWR